MKSNSIIKLGLLAVGGYLAYDWYKKRNAAKSVVISSSAAIDGEYSNVPFSEQPERVQLGDHLSIAQKEQYILENGNISVFSGGVFASADGNTDNVMLEMALAEQDGEEGLDTAMLDTTPSSVLKDSKCALDKMKAKFPDTDWGAVYEDQVTSLYVAVKCQIALLKGDLDCDSTPAAKKAAKMGERASDKMKERNPKAVAAILRGCKNTRRNGKGKPRGIRHGRPMDDLAKPNFKKGRPTSAGESVESIFVKGRERNYSQAGIPVDASMSSASGTSAGRDICKCRHSIEQGGGDYMVYGCEKYGSCRKCCKHFDY